MTQELKLTGGLIALIALGACSSSTEALTHARQLGALNSLQGMSDAEVFTPLANNSNSGTGSYQGYLESTLVLAGRPDSRLVGGLEMEVDFANHTVTGSAGDFVEARDSERFGGELTLNNGQLGRAISAGFITADLTGVLTDPLGREVEVDADIVGRMLGAGGQYIAGAISGDVTGQTSSGGPINGRIENGAFVVGQ